MNNHTTHFEGCDCYKEKLSDITRRLEKAKEALKFYSKGKNWSWTEKYKDYKLIDCGSVAKRALEKLESKELANKSEIVK